MTELIVYVEDINDGLTIPTCHITSSESIFDDSNFDLAQKNADAITKDIQQALIEKGLSRSIPQNKSGTAHEPYICCT